MFDIDTPTPSPDFLNCWKAAGNHFNNQVPGGIQSWLRAHPYPPFLEHLSFRIGNQLLFVRLEAEDGSVDFPGNRDGLRSIARGCKGHACLLPMKRHPSRRDWVTARPGWGLIDATTMAQVDPPSLVTNEKIEMTEWELQDFAVQVVRDQLEKTNFRLMSWQGNPSVDPSIWFVGDSKGPEWVVVRAVRYPENTAKKPENLRSIAASCEKMSKIGHFASVAFVSVEQSFDPGANHTAPLWRGGGTHVRYEGLERII